MLIKITSQELKKYYQFLTYAEKEPTLSESLLKNWDTLSKTTFILLDFGISLGVFKRGKKEREALSKKEVYKLIHDNSDVFRLLIQKYEAAFKKERKEYLYKLKIGEMTGAEYEEYLGLIGVLK